MKNGKLATIMPMVKECPFSLMDDIAFRIAMAGNKVAAKKIIATVFARTDFEVKSVRVQARSDAVRQHSVYFDAVVAFVDGTHVAVEVQNIADKMPWERVLYYQAMMRISYSLKKGEEDYRKSLPVAIIIFVRGDILGRGVPFCHINHVLLEDGTILDPNQGIYIVNTEMPQETNALNQLVKDITSNKLEDVSDEDFRKALRRVQWKWRKGDKKMSEEFEVYLKQRDQLLKKEMMISLVKEGHLALDVAAEKLGISPLEVEKELQELDED